MSNKLSTAEVLAALIITIGLFIGSLGIFDGARSADFRPGLMPKCQDRHQLTFKAILHCDQTLDEKGYVS